MILTIVGILTCEKQHPGKRHGMDGAGKIRTDSGVCSNSLEDSHFLITDPAKSPCYAAAFGVARRGRCCAVAVVKQGRRQAGVNAQLSQKTVKRKKTYCQPAPAWWYTEGGRRQAAHVSLQTLLTFHCARRMKTSRNSVAASKGREG